MLRQVRTGVPVCVTAAIFDGYVLARSPLHHADQIRCPVLFFQGMKDRVVPPAQTERMASALRHNGIAVEVRLFEDEGHGFRDSAVQIQVLEETETFFRRHLGL